MTETQGQPDTADPVEAPGPVEAASYIEQISTELAAMARRSRLELLAYLLEMVRLEAGARAGVSGRASGHDRH